MGKTDNDLDLLISETLRSSFPLPQRIRSTLTPEIRDLRDYGELSSETDIHVSVMVTISAGSRGPCSGDSKGKRQTVGEK